MTFKDQKIKWWNGFRDTTGKVLTEIPDVYPESFGIPASMRKAELMRMDPKNEKQLLVMNSMWKMCNDKEAPTTMIVSGGNGTGKTYLGCALVHTLGILQLASNVREWNPLYIDEASLLMKLSGYESGAFFRFITRECRMLVYDEFAMTQWSPAEKRKIEQVLNVRQGNNLAYVLLTNRTSDELYSTAGGTKEPILSSQLRSRLAPGYNINLIGPDLRRNRPAFDDNPDLPF